MRTRRKSAPAPATVRRAPGRRLKDHATNTHWEENMRKILLAATMLAGLTTAASAEDIVLRFWDNQQTESGLSQYQQEAVKRFEADNPGIKVEVTTIPYPEFQQRLLTAVQGGNAPDVSTIDQIWVAAFAAAGAIDPLDDRAKSAGITARTFFPGA